MSALGERQRPGASKGKEHVLEVASRLVATRGYEQTRLMDVAKAADVSISTLQYSFGSRDDLLVAAFDHAHLVELDGLDRVAQSGGDPWERLANYIDYAIDGHDGEVAWLLWLEFWRGAKRHERLEQRAAEVHDRWLAVLRRIIEDGLHEGVFDVDAEVAADEVLAIIDGLALASLVHRRESDLDLARARAHDAARRLLGRR